MSIAVLGFQNKGEGQKLLRYLLVPSRKPKVFTPACQECMNNSARPPLRKSSIKKIGPWYFVHFEIPQTCQIYSKLFTTTPQTPHRVGKKKISLGHHLLQGRIHKGTISIRTNNKQDQ